MPGPRYVDNFDFPSDFGFTGSASDRSTVPVRPHERRKPQRFAEGGRVRKPPEETKPLTPKPEAEEQKSNKQERASLMDHLRGTTRRKREAELGLKKGGRAKKAMGGPVKAQKGGMHRMPDGSMMKNSSMKKRGGRC